MGSGEKEKSRTEPQGSPVSIREEQKGQTKVKQRPDRHGPEKEKEPQLAVTQDKEGFNEEKTINRVHCC